MSSRTTTQRQKRLGLHNLVSSAQISVRANLKLQTEIDQAATSIKTVCITLNFYATAKCYFTFTVRSARAQQVRAQLHNNIFPFKITCCLAYLLMLANFLF